MENDIERVLIPALEIQELCKKLGDSISKDYEGKRPIFVGLLKGALPFMGDLLKNVSVYAETEYIRVKSYDGTKSGAEIKLTKDLETDVTGRDVIIVDDILDTGRTVLYIKTLLEQRGAASVEVCCLLNKPEGRLVDVDAKYIGGFVPNEFVVGYGLDYNELYRNLPYIGVLKKEIYN